MKKYAFLFVVVLAVCGAAFADTWYVDGANTSGTEDGTSWGTAFTVIQDGIDDAGADDEVWVAAGTYEESITLASGVSVYGGFDGTESELSERDIANNPTIIDASTADHVVLMDSTTDARIDGFILTGGYADGIYPHAFGGGILAVSADGTNTIAGCTIAGNSAQYGGGVTCLWASPVITDCTISGNQALNGGGGLALADCASPLTNCVISGNSASSGGGVYCEIASPSITNCTISANEAGSGGGVHCWLTSPPTIANTIFEGNTNQAIYESDSSSDPTVTNCLFYNNPDGDYRDNDTATTYTGGTNINTNMPEASGNLSSYPAFVMDGLAATTGTWTDVALDSGVTILTDDTASFTPDALVGKLINPDTTQRGEVLIVANTATTIDVMGDVTGYVAIADAYAVADYHIRYGSGGLDTGAAEIITGDGIVTDTEPNDTIGAPQDIDDEMWTLRYSADIGNTTTNTSETIPHVTILGTGNNTFDVYSFTIANAGDAAIFDIDYGYGSGGSVDCYIRVYDSDSTLLAYDDDSPTTYGQGGSVHGFDSYVEYTFSTAGTYYIQVAQFVQNPIPAGTDYRLQISIENHALPAIVVPTDMDGEPRPFDVPGWGADGTGEEYDIGADEFVDTDEDQLADYEEMLLGTDPDDPDTDDDGLYDGGEVYSWGTDPLDDDTDDDGLTDYDELATYWTDPNNPDTDGDGLDDGEEVLTYETNPLDSDSDDDGVSDGDEVNTYGSDPNDVDTDDDGYTDGTEVTAGSNPTDPDSYPLWYVDEDATGAADGTSWTDAFTVIQDGIDAASALGGEVWVADGTYLEGITLASGVAVMGGFDRTEELLSERDIANNQTIIDATPWGEQTIGEGTGVWELPMHTFWHDSRTQVIYLSSEIGSAGWITSLALDVTGLPGQTMNNWTIRMKHTSLSEYTTAEWEGSGWTTVYQNNETVSSTGWVTFNFSTPFHYNGADNLMIDFSHNNSSWTSSGYCSYSTPGGNRTVYYYTDSGYGDPLAWSGTTNPTPIAPTNVPNIRLGVDQYHAVLISGTSNARIDGFTITGGNADGTAYPHFTGGGILCSSAGSSNTIANCTITGNSGNHAGGVFCDNSSLSITGCTISGNEALVGDGGGIYCYMGSSPSIDNCVISGNSSFSGSFGGGGVSCAIQSNPSITNCTISANEALLGGGMSCILDSTPLITNTVFEDNTNHAVYEYDGSSDPTVTNCLFYNNPDGDYFDEGTTSYTGADDINGIPDGFATNNVEGDPMFVMNGPAGITGSWTAVVTDTGNTTLIDDSASFTPGALVGKLINADTSQRGQVLIVANTDTAVEVLGDVAGYVAVDDTYQVIDYHLRNGSPAIDTGGVVEIAFGDGMVTDTEPNDTIAAAQNIDSEMWNLDFSPDIGDTTTNTSESILHVTIWGTGNGSFDFYSLTVANAGDRGIFDIDYGYLSGGSVDCYLRLYDSDGIMIDYNDDADDQSHGQGGSVHWYDSYLEHTFAAPGVYYIEVADYPQDPIATGADYQLQISLENHEFPTTALATDFDGEPRPIDVAGLGANGTGEEYDIGADEYLDSDGDGLSDQEEIVLGTDPDDADTDDDGLTDGDEVDTHDTDPNDPDSDDDGLPDGWEIDNGFNPLDDTGDNGGDGDPDGDGLTNEGEHANDTDPNDADSDDDGLPDGWEVQNDLDPNDDTGDDGASGDPDHDDLTNAGEYGNDTDPNDSDSDGDGLPDGWEVDNDLDPNDSTGDNGADGDPDGDGITNLEEYEEGYDPGLPAPVAVLTASVTSGIRPLEVDFKDESTGSITSRAWNLGDGYTTTEQDPSHTYYFTGDYTVTLTVTGPGGVDSETVVIHVDQAMAAPGAAYKAVINGVKVTYSRPTCFACYNHMQDSLLIAVWGTEPGALVVTAKEDAPVLWGSNCDIVIDAPDTYIKKANLKGREEMKLYVCGQVGYVTNFILKHGYVGDTGHYGEAFGLGSSAQDPAKKILIKWGATTAALFGLEYPALRAVPASVEEALARLEMQTTLKPKPFYAVLDDELDEDDVDDEDYKLAELEFEEVEASAEAKAAYTFEYGDVKVRYTKPGCVAFYNDEDDTLTIQVTESAGDLLVKCGEEAYLAWQDYCDLVIRGPDASINNVILKGRPETQLHVIGNVAYVKNLKLKYGTVGDTEFYGPHFGLYNTTLVPPNKILIKWGWMTAPALGVSY